MFEIIKKEQLSQCYSIDSEHRYHTLINKFKNLYGAQPEFIARAPGRVNLIGEHIDYEGYGVLPAAIEKDCLIAFKVANQQFVQVNHVLSDAFPPCKLSKYPSKISNNIEHSYAKYFAAGYRAGILDLIEEEKVVGLNLLIQGNIPWASGVSSSSAFCVCSAIVSNHANKVKQIPKSEFVERCIKFEREVGTASGGMDQSISILGKNGSSLYIQFNPIKATKVNVPSEEFKFIIMNSLVESAKLNTAVYRYNKRVCECRIATRLLAIKMGVSQQIYSKWTILKQIQQWTQLQLSQMPYLVNCFIPKLLYTKQMLQKEIGSPLIDLLSGIPLAKQVLEANQHFSIYEAAYHVYTEAYRVINFIDVCKSPLKNQVKGEILGQLMNQSQSSCRDLYQCSCQELDELTKNAMENGAVGSRLTGAGWGGCTVSLVAVNKVEDFMQKMRQSYYSKQQIKEKVEKAGGIDNCLFASKPSEGACIISLS